MMHTARAFLAVSLVFGGGIASGAFSSLSAWSMGRNPYQGLDTFARALTTIEQRHVDARDIDELVAASLRGLASELDAHSHYLSPEEYEALREENEGRYQGIGVRVELEEGRGYRILEVVRLGPAAIAGVQVDDLLVAVDGQAVQGEPILDSLLQGRRGEAVVLTIERAEKRVDLRVIRDEVIQQSVTAAWLTPGIAYLRIDQFRVQTGDQLSAELQRLAPDRAKLQGVVLDLRENPGGLVDEGADVMDHFLPDGVLVTTERRGDAKPDVMMATKRTDVVSAPLVVLVDRGSASAAELVAGGLQARGRAKVVGERSYGKGSMQQVFEFEDGSALKLTIGRYALPDGRVLADNEGIVPDVEVQRQTAADQARARLSAAIAALPTAQAVALQADLAALPDDEDDAPTPIDWDRSPTERLADDPQLQAALAAVKRR
jgi:carboxyl-terminal processing protease